MTAVALSNRGLARLGEGILPIKDWSNTPYRRNIAAVLPSVLADLAETVVHGANPRSACRHTGHRIGEDAVIVHAAATRAMAARGATERPTHRTINAVSIVDAE